MQKTILTSNLINFLPINIIVSTLLFTRNSLFIRTKYYNLYKLAGHFIRAKKKYFFYL